MYLRILVLLVFLVSPTVFANKDGPYRGGDPLKSVKNWVKPAEENTEPEAPLQPPSVDVKIADHHQIEQIIAKDEDAVRQVVVELIGKLWMPWDTGTVSVIVVPHLVPEIAFTEVKKTQYDQAEKHLVLSLGVLGFVKNSDELAFLVARELARREPGRLQSSHSQELLEALIGVENLRDLGSSQNSELAADILAIERLIKGGFNPVAAHNYLEGIGRWWQSLTRGNSTSEDKATLWHNRPALEQRLEVVKLYLLKKIEEQDLSEQTSKLQPLPERLSMLSYRIQKALFFVESPIGRFLGLERTFGRKQYQHLAQFLHGFYRKPQKLQASTPVVKRPEPEVKHEKRSWKPSWNITWKDVGELVTGGAKLVGAAAGMVAMAPVVATVSIYKFVRDDVVPGAYDAIIATGNFLGYYGTGRAFFETLFPENQRKIIQQTYTQIWGGKRDYMTEFREGKEIPPHAVWNVVRELTFELKRMNSEFGSSFLFRSFSTFNGHMYFWEDRVFHLARALPLLEPEMKRRTTRLAKILPSVKKELEELTKEVEKAADVSNKKKKRKHYNKAILKAVTLARKTDVSDYAIEQFVKSVSKNSESALREFNDRVMDRLHQRAGISSNQILEGLPLVLLWDVRLRDGLIKVIEAVDPVLHDSFLIADLPVAHVLAKLRKSRSLDSWDMDPEIAIGILLDFTNRLWAPLGSTHYHDWKDRLHSHSVSGKASNEFRESFIALLNYFKEYYPDKSYVGKLKGEGEAFPSWDLFSRYWRSALKGEAATLAEVSLNEDFGQNFLFRILMKGERQMLKSNLHLRFHSISEVTSTAEQQWRAKGVRLETFSQDFAAVLLEHPEWIRGRTDVDALLDAGYLWPQLGSIKQSSFESRMLGMGLSSMFNELSHWKYDPKFSIELQKAIMIRLRETSEFPESIVDQIDLWRRMTERGITWVSDQFLEEILEDANEEERAQIYALAVGERRIWDPVLKSELLWDRISNSEEYKSLMANRAEELTESQQSHRIELLAEILKKQFPPGTTPEEFVLLERLSRDIATSWKESLHIAKFLKSKFSDEGTDQRGRMFQQLFEVALDWPAADQWNLIFFLRGNEEPSNRLKEMFSYMGPERIQRMFQNLGVPLRITLFSFFLGGQRGLLKRESLFGKSYARQILDRISESQDPDAASIGLEMLDAFFQALEHANFEFFKSQVISSLLAIDPSELSSPVHVLKQGCIAIGTTGIKLGQQMASARIFKNPRDNEVLLDLQSEARDTLRHQVYSDILGELGQEEMPFRLLDALGSASIKRADMALDYETGRTLVLKLMYQQAINKTNLEFRFIEAMATILKKKNAKRYFMFGSVVRAAKEAVQRELSIVDEVKRSKLAQQLYARFPDFKVPNEEALTSRLSASEFAEGENIRKLSPRQQAQAAARILQSGEAIMFPSTAGESPDTLHPFCPDRHAGNFRVQVSAVGSVAMIHPIDWGQLISISNAQRQQVVRLFALAKILAEVGPTRELQAMILETLALTEISQQDSANLLETLHDVFPAKGAEPMAAYYTLLSVLENWGRPQPIVFFDFARGLMQYAFYHDYLSPLQLKQTGGPVARMERLVQEEVDQILPKLSDLRVRLALKFGLVTRAEDCEEAIKPRESR